MLLCPACCLHKSQTLLSLLPSPLHISICFFGNVLSTCFIKKELENDYTPNIARWRDATERVGKHEHTSPLNGGNHIVVLTKETMLPCGAVKRARAGLIGASGDQLKALVWFWIIDET
jgi:hypothetical protein